MTSVEFKRLYVDSALPRKAHDTDAGFDLYACTANSHLGGVVDLMPGERMLIRCGFAMALPPGYEAQVRPRSGLALKHGLSVINSPGTVDESYRAEVGVVLINHGQETFRINHGDRIAQMIVQKLPEIEVVEVDELTPATERGEAGFGSSGV